MKMKGVNLGNWLVLEKWMSPALFYGTDAEDEYDLPRALPREVYEARIRIHRAEYISEGDFVRIKAMGLNTARIPVPFFIFGDVEPYIGCIEELDKAFAWARRYGLQILIDLHTVPGGQNGFDNSGACGLCTWHQHPEYVEETLTLLEALARRYAPRKSLFGIGPINEPASENIMALNAFLFGEKYPERVAQSEAVPDSFLKEFYLEVYRRIKPLLPEDAVIVLSDQFDLARWETFMPADEYPGVWLEAHKYLTFSEGMIAYDGLPSAYAYRAKADQIQGGLILQNYLRLIRDVFADEVLRAARFHPVLVGEWCLVQNMEDIKNARDEEEIRSLYRQLADAHLEIWEQAEGGAYWSYKVDDSLPEAWDFRKCVSKGWLNYTDRE